MWNDAAGSDTEQKSDAERIASIHAVMGEERLARSALARCLAPLLMANHWNGAPRRLVGGLSSGDPAFGIPQLQRVLSTQGLRLVSRPWSSWSGGLATLPAGSVVLTATAALVYLGSSGRDHHWHDGKDCLSNQDVDPAATVLLVSRDSGFSDLNAPQVGWLDRLIYSARRELGGIMFVSLIANLLALGISLYTMFVYNAVIPTGATTTLWTMTTGVLIAIVGAWALRLTRVTLTSRLTGWAGLRISEITFGKTLGLPADVSTRLGLENNLIRLRSLETTRQWFGGGGGAVNADYPFVLIFLLVIAILGGWIVIVPLVGLLLFALASWPLTIMLNARSVTVSRVNRQLGEVLGVMSSRLRALRGVPPSAPWRRQLGDLVAQSVASNRDYALANALAQTVGQALSGFIVLGTLGVGIALVLDKAMSTGGLIAAMMLIWRVTTPAQQLFASQVRIKQLLDSGRQLDRLLSSTGEASSAQLSTPIDLPQPELEADRLYHRHGADREPALAGISFKVGAGQTLAVVGPNGAGKTTLLEVLSGLRSPQSGRVRLDGLDILQFDPVDFRAWLGHLPQRIPGLGLSVRQMMRLRRPASTDQELQTALERVAGPEWWKLLGASSLDAGLDLPLDPWSLARDAVRGRFIVQLATALVGDPPLVLLDDPLPDRDPVLDRYLLQILAELRGKATVVLATHRPELIQRADLILVLDGGALAHFGPLSAPGTAAATA